MSLFSPKPGFTLAELLIALALLGIIAAFTIPKVLQSSAENERVAKLRETVATLEQSWYNARATNQVVATGPTNTLYETLAPQLNTVRSSAAQIGNAGEFFESIAHPCDGPTTGEGYAVFPNGVVVIGLGSNLYTPNELLVPTSMENMIICIDINGATSPNLVGQDIFFGNFHQWGDFDFGGGVYTPSVNSRNFHWGSANEPVYEINGLPGAYTSEAMVGYWLTR